MSPFSTAQVHDSGWSSENFMLGAGMVIIQPATHKIVLVYDTHKEWFLPRGRKDIGETLEAAALREAYEESGYRVRFLPLYAPTHAPAPPSNRDARMLPMTEALYTTVSHWSAGRGNRRQPGEYMTFWYAGQIPRDAVHTPNTGMPDEQNYKSYLCTYEEVLERLGTFEKPVFMYIWAVYVRTLQIMEEEAERQTMEEAERQTMEEAERQTKEEVERQTKEELEEPPLSPPSD
ncbi:hypothetical protein DXG01_012571 [Tephrocybe rancida]|nr:hypothetical protein DXG01_012571 [Tephrocybe rancida]